MRLFPDPKVEIRRKKPEALRLGIMLALSSFMINLSDERMIVFGYPCRSRNDR